MSLLKNSPSVIQSISLAKNRTDPNSFVLLLAGIP